MRKIIIVIIFFISSFIGSLSGQSYFSFSQEKDKCVVLKIEGSSCSPIDSLSNSKSYTVLGNKLYSLFFTRIAHDGLNYINISEHEITDQGLVHRSNFKFELKQRISFIRYDFFLRGADLVLTYNNDSLSISDERIIPLSKLPEKRELITDFIAKYYHKYETRG